MNYLSDVIDYSLNVVFCGTAPGRRAAELRAYYAGRGNKFWPILYEIGLTPRLLQPEEYMEAREYGIGLTNIVQNRFGSDAEVRPTSRDAIGFIEKIEQYAPKTLAFNSKKSAEVVYAHRVEYGRQPEDIGTTAVFVLPSTSGAANGFWNAKYWYELAQFICKCRRKGSCGL